MKRRGYEETPDIISMCREKRLGIANLMFPDMTRFKTFTETMEKRFAGKKNYVRQPYLVNQRHQKALENMYEILKKRYAECEWLTGEGAFRNILLGDMTYFETTPTNTAMLDKDSDTIIPGAAVYILDLLKQDPATAEELKRLLAEEQRYHHEKHPNEEPKKYTYLKFIEHSDQEFQSVIRILTKRNEEALKKIIEEQALENREILNSVLAQGKQNETKSTYRTFFNRLISLLPEGVDDAAIDEMESIQLQILDLYFRESEKVTRELEKAIRAYMQVYEQLIQCREKAEKTVGKKDISERVKQFQEYSMDRMFPENGLRKFAKPTSSLPGDHNEVNELMNLESKEKQLLTKMKELTERRVERLTDAMMIMERASFSFNPETKNCNKNMSEEETIHYTLPEMPNPFRVGFALLMAGEKNRDSVWCGGITDIVLRYYNYMLPWTHGLSYLCDDGTETEKMLELYKEGMNPDNCEYEMLTSWEEYKPEYDTGKENEDGLLSMAQLIYQLTGFLLPRNIGKENAFYQLFRDIGFDQKDARLMTYLVRIYRDYIQKCREQQLPDEAEEETETVSSEENPEVLKAKIRELTQKCKGLEKQLYEAERANRKKQEALETMQQEAEEDKTELTDLREFVFNMQTEEKEEDETENAEDLPYSVQKNTLVFGGHKTWLKAIKQMLNGNIRFIEDRSTYSFDPGIIDGADVVWLQVNAISHTAYYRVVEKARAAHKPVHYFSKASALAGARQVIQKDTN